MIRKTALLTGVAAALAFSAPALAQDAVIPAAPEAAPAQPAEGSQLALQPGAEVAGTDGVVFGRLDGAGQGADGSVALHVRTEDGQVKAVPAAGVSMNGATIVTGWSKAQFDAAPLDPALNPEPQGDLTLTPGATVVGSGGATLGTLQGASQGADGAYNILVRGADGQVRAVPAEGLTMNGANVVTAWTQAEFDAAQVDAAATAEAPVAPTQTPAEAPTEVDDMASPDGMETTPE